MLLQCVRSFFFNNQYLEVDTPLRFPYIIPELNIIPFQVEGGFLQSSPELCMKLLLGSGCSKIFQICHCFRQEEVGVRHQPEFSMLEWYHAGWDYRDLMNECEVFIRNVAKELNGFSGLVPADHINYCGRKISLELPWQRLSVRDAFHKYAGISPLEALQQDRFDEILVTDVEPNLGWDTPCFLYDYPTQLASLARKKASNHDLAERFELYVGGLELANGFSELIDADEQRKRFASEIKAIKQKYSLDIRVPEQLLKALENMEDTAGVALGFDRLFMLFFGIDDIASAVTLSVEDMKSDGK